MVEVIGSICKKKRTIVIKRAPQREPVMPLVDFPVITYPQPKFISSGRSSSTYFLMTSLNRSIEGVEIVTPVPLNVSVYTVPRVDERRVSSDNVTSPVDPTAMNVVKGVSPGTPPIAAITTQAGSRIWLVGTMVGPSLNGLEEGGIGICPKVGALGISTTRQPLCEFVFEAEFLPKFDTPK